jgi:hypothetical protein
LTLNQGEWTADTSRVAPTPAETLAALIHDLTAGLSAETKPQSPSELPAQPSSHLPVIEVPVEAADVAAESAESTDMMLDETVLAQLDQLLADPAQPTHPPKSSLPQEAWFLGIDFGTTGISAVLLNQSQCRLYPLYWQSVDSAFAAASKKFRLATAVTLATTEPTASPLPTIRFDAAADAPRLSLSEWKPYLKLAVPHHSPHTSSWQPVLQWSSYETVPLRTLQEALQQLLATLNPERAPFIPTFTCGALGLETEAFQEILRQLDGVILGYPSNWSDTYSFNLREAILQAGLVNRPDQIFFVEEAIATLLSALPATDGRSIALAQPGQQGGHLHNADWHGATLIVTAGTSLTELVLVDLPIQLQNLNHTDFYVRSLPYGGQGIDQDIILQLLYPALSQLEAEPTGAAASAEAEPTTAYSFTLEPLDLQQLNLDNLVLAAADLDLEQRHQIQQRLIGSTSGQQLLACARSLKFTLQQQTQFTLKYDHHRLSFSRQDFTGQVLLPYVQRLNRELNALLAQTNTTAAAVNQVICTGGTASLAVIARWLRQKLPNATIIQDTYPRPTSENCIPSCSRVAYGLAVLPLHPQVIDQARHQYSDYFLLKHLLQLPQQPLQLETVMQHLEQQGIDTAACRFRILALLEAHLPPGLVPAVIDAALLTPESAANPDYQALRLAPLFTKQADRTYEPNRAQWQYLQQYLETLLSDSEQTLEQPLSLSLLLHPSPEQA